MKKKLAKVGKAVWSVVSNKQYAPEEKAIGVSLATSLLLALGASAGLVNLASNVINSLP